MIKEEAMKRFLWLGLLVVAIFLVGCPINPPDTENTNITIDDIKGEWDFSNVKINGKVYNPVHVFIEKGAHGTESQYHNRVDITIGDSSYYWSDGDFDDNVYKGEYTYGVKDDQGNIHQYDEPQDIEITFSLIDGKLRMQVQADGLLGSFTIELFEGGENQENEGESPVLTPAEYSQVEGNWTFTNVWIPNQPEGVGFSFFTTCTLNIYTEHIGESSIETMHFTGVDNHGYTCKYDGQFASSEGMIYQYSYNYDIKDAGGNLKAESDYAKTITVKFFLTGDGKLFVEFDSDGQPDPGPLDGVMLTYGEKQD
jgi:major membrane immunogen (membrane-anchored lipoprotein)